MIIYNLKDEFSFEDYKIYKKLDTELSIINSQIKFQESQKDVIFEFSEIILNDIINLNNISNINNWNALLDDLRLSFDCLSNNIISLNLLKDKLSKIKKFTLTIKANSYDNDSFQILCKELFQKLDNYELYQSSLQEQITQNNIIVEEFIHNTLLNILETYSIIKNNNVYNKRIDFQAPPSPEEVLLNKYLDESKKIVASISNNQRNIEPIEFSTNFQTYDIVNNNTNIIDETTLNKQVIKDDKIDNNVDDKSDYEIDNKTEDKRTSDDKIDTKADDEANNKTDDELQDNNTLIISERENKIYLPYKIQDLLYILKKSNKYSSIEEIILNKYILPLDQFKNSIQSRFREAFNLMKYKEHESFISSLKLGIELMFNYKLNPAVISACKNLKELKTFLKCLDNGNIDSFKNFSIKYDVTPLKIK